MALVVIARVATVVRVLVFPMFVPMLGIMPPGAGLVVVRIAPVRVAIEEVAFTLAVSVGMAVPLPAVGITPDDVLLSVPFVGIAPAKGDVEAEDVELTVLAAKGFSVHPAGGSVETSLSSTVT